MTTEMSSDAHAELYRQLLMVSEQAPLPVLAQCLEAMATVLAKRIHDEMGEVVVW